MLYKKLSLFIYALALVILLSGCAKKLPTLTALSTKQLTQELVLQAQLSKSNAHAYVLTEGPQFNRWDIASGEVIQSIGRELLPQNTRSFVISENESQFVTSDGKSLSLWELDSFRIIGSLDFRQQLGDASIYSVVFIDDSVLAVGNSDGSIIFADLVNSVFRKRYAHSNEVVRLSVGHQKKYLYSAGNDGKVITTDLQELLTKNEYKTPFRVTSMISNSDDSLIFISDALDQQVIWQPWQNRVVARLDYWQQYRFFRRGMFIADDTLLLTTSPKTGISVWNTTTGKEVANWTAVSQSLGSTVMDIQELSGSQIMTITSDSVIETWDLSALLSLQ